MILKSSQCIVLEVYLLIKVHLHPAVLRTFSFRIFTTELSYFQNFEPVDDSIEPIYLPIDTKHLPSRQWANL
jgi:hypothetical protein